MTQDNMTPKNEVLKTVENQEKILNSKPEIRTDITLDLKKINENIDHKQNLISTTQEEINRIRTELGVSADTGVVEPSIQAEMDGIKKLEEKKSELNNPQKIENTDIEENITIPENVNQDVGEINPENSTAILEAYKDEKFKELEDKFIKYNTESKEELNPVEVNKALAAALNKPEEINKIIGSLPKEFVMNLVNNTQNYESINAFRNWNAKVGGQINSLSNNRVDYYDNSNKKELVKLGTVPENTKDYLIISSNAARFVPKEVSEKFIKDAVDAFVDKNKKFAAGDKSFAYTFGQESGSDVIRNLCESGYKEEAKKLLMASFTDETRLSLEARIPGNSGLLFKLSEQNLLSKEEVREILDKSGYLEESKQEIKNEGWGE